MKAAAGEERLSSLLPIPTGTVFLLKKKKNFPIVFPPNPTFAKEKASGSFKHLHPNFLTITDPDAGKASV